MGKRMSNAASEHYLKSELYQKFREDPVMFEFLQSGPLAGVWYWDLETPENEWMSPEFWQILGYDSTGRQHLAVERQALINPEDLAGQLDNFKQHCANPDHPYDQVSRYRHSDGSTVWVRCRGFAIRDENGQPVRMFGAHNDITELNRLEVEEKSINGRIQEVAESHENLEEFASIASHDLSAPLRRMTTFLGLISEKIDLTANEELLGWMESVNGNAKHMQCMIDDLLQLSRTSAADLEYEQLDLNQIVSEVLNNLSLDKGGWQGEVTIEPLPLINGIKPLITCLFQNLIKNAMTYSKPEESRLRVFATEDADATTFWFEDNGIGIESTHHEKVFEPFKRLHSRQHFGGGTGMGLAICRRIVKRTGCD